MRRPALPGPGPLLAARMRCRPRTAFSFPRAALTPAAPWPSWRPGPLPAARPSSPHEPSTPPLPLAPRVSRVTRQPPARLTLFPSLPCWSRATAAARIFLFHPAATLAPPVSVASRSFPFLPQRLSFFARRWRYSDSKPPRHMESGRMEGHRRAPLPSFHAVAPPAYKAPSRAPPPLPSSASQPRTTAARQSAAPVP